jgi:hypothetical protein
MKLGDKKQIPVYRFAKDALIARYGQEWYQELESAAENLEIV